MSGVEGAQEFAQVALATRFTKLLLWFVGMASPCVLGGPCMSTDLISSNGGSTKGAFIAKVKPDHENSKQSIER